MNNAAERNTAVCSRRTLLKGLGAFGLASLVGSAGFGSSLAFAEGEVEGGVLNISLPSSPKYLDPVKYTGTYESQVIYGVCNTLVEYAMDLSGIVPGIATAWEVADDGVTYTFDIRDDVKFQPGAYQDGRAMTAEDVAYSLERSARESALNRLDMLDHCNVLSDTRLECVLKTPTASFLTALTNSGNVIVPREEVEGWGDSFGDHLVGTGPFILKSFVQDQQSTLVRFDGFWGQRPLLDGVNFKVVTDMNQAANGLQTREIDIATSLTGEAVELVRQNPDLDLRQTEGLHVAYVYFNQVNGPTADQRVRKALLMALNRDEILRGVYQYGEAAEACLPLPKGSWGYDASIEADVPAYDPEAAKALMAEAGYPDGCTLSLYISNTNARLRLATIMQAELKASLNIDIEIHAGDWGTFSADASSGKADMYGMSWTWYPDPFFFLNKLFYSGEVGALGNGAGFNHEEVDELLELALAVTEQDERAEYYKQALKAIVSYDPIFVYASEYVNSGVTPAVQGYVDRADGVIATVNSEVNVWKSAE